MDKCRICLTYRKSLIPIFDLDTNNISSAIMISSIANVKIAENSKCCICRMCCSKLREAYNFKNIIEQSDVAFYDANNMKKINFNNLNDIKSKTEIKLDTKPIIKTCSDVNKNFKEGVEEFCYINTVIKKVDTLPNRYQEPTEVLDFLNSIKAEPDDTDSYDMHDDYPDSCDNDDNYVPPYKTLKTEEATQKFRRKKLTTKKAKVSKYHIKNKMQQVCIKPKLLKDLKLVNMLDVKPKKDKPKHVYRGKCEICPYCGKMINFLKSHLLLHTAERNFHCEMCDKAFFTAQMLQYHMKQHDTNKEFKCDKCMAAFITKGSLNWHMLTHSDDKKYVCSVCKKAFKRKSTMIIHERRHNSANKNIMCELCNMSFFSKFGLKHHMRVHTGERPYNCEICSQPYSYKHDFNRHCFKKHGIFLKGRSVHVMNEEVLKQEKSLTRDLLLRVHGMVKDDKLLNSFQGPRGAWAFDKAMKELGAKQIPLDFQS